MSDMYTLIMDIALALITAKIFNYVLVWLKQPGVLGEIFAGMILGPYGLSHLSGISINILGMNLYTFKIDFLSDYFHAVAFIGIILLLFVSGLDVKFDDFKKMGKGGMLTSIFDVSVAFMFGYLVGMVLGMSPAHSLAIGAILTATSVGITVRTLTEANSLSTRFGLMILTVAVLDDIWGILILSVVLGTGSAVELIIKVVVFFVLTLGIGLPLIGYVMKIDKLIRIPLILSTTGLTICFFFAALAHSMGLAAITGAFVAGLIISKTPQAKIVSEHIKTVGYAFFIPLFFVWVGANFDFKQLGGIGPIVLLFIPLAFLGKIIGCSLGSKISGLSNWESLIVGVGMIPRMEVALIVITTEISMGIFTGALAHQMLASTLLLVIITSLLTPPILKIMIKRGESKKESKNS